MDLEILERKLTPAATQALDELVAEHRRRLLLAAAESASRFTGDVREISVQDIMASVTSRGRVGMQRTRIVESLLRTYAVIGACVAAGSMLYISYGDLIQKMDPSSRWFLMLGLGGAIVSLASFSILQNRRLRVAAAQEWTISPYAVSDHVSAFLQSWQRVELAVRNKVAMTSGESTANKPLSLLIKDLEREGFLSVNDVVRLREILEMRNRLVHAGPAPAPEELANAIRDASHLFDRLDGVSISVGFPAGRSNSA